MRNCAGTGYRDKMRDECVEILILLLRARNIDISDIVRRTGIKERTVRRWIKSYSLLIPIQIFRGRVTVMDGWDLAGSSDREQEILHDPVALL